MLAVIDQCMLEADKRYKVTNLKIDTFFEAAMSQFEINCKKAELKVMQESGTVDDLGYLQEKAEGGVIENVKAAIEKIIEALKKFVNDIKLKILSIITKNETKKNMIEIEKKIKFNPFLARKKVTIEDNKKQMKVIAWDQAEYYKLVAKIKSGKEVETSAVDKIDATFKKKMREASSVSAAMKVNLSAAMATVKMLGDKMGETIDKVKKNGLDLIDDAKETANELHVTMAPTIKKICSAVSTVTKIAIQAIIGAFKSGLSIIRSAVSKVKDRKNGNSTNNSTASDETDTDVDTDIDTDDTEDETTNESAYDAFLRSLSDDMGMTMNESSSDFLGEIENELFGESTFDTDDFDAQDDDEEFVESFAFLY